ncbi:MAG TPA: type II toxin-antitoxin system VapC family toxin [Terriglobales bacterium]|nr:type II toxin-antitoxin system VapC family toxin [Terriglobales bacterium]
MSLVLDSSITLAWVYADETTSTIREIFQQVRKRGAWVPALWHLELGNALEMGVRRRRNDRKFRDSTFADLSLLPIHVDPETDQHAWGTTAHLAEQYGLTLYDAAYLELAQRRGLPLATLDVDLRRAARRDGTPVLDIN